MRCVSAFNRVHRLVCLHPDPRHLLVPLLDAVHVLLVLDLQLVEAAAEVDGVQHVAHLRLLLELRFDLLDVRLDRRVLGRDAVSKVRSTLNIDMSAATGAVASTSTGGTRCDAPLRPVHETCTPPGPSPGHHPPRCQSRPRLVSA